MVDLAPILRNAARLTGYPVAEMAGFATRGQGEVRALEVVVMHHTADGPTGDYPSRDIVAFGRAGLRGLLSQLGLARSGTIHLLGAKLAWHAGASDWMGFWDLNDESVGIEAESVGTRDDWTPEQRDCYPRLVAAILYYANRNKDRAAFHREVANPPGRKIDPAYWSNPQTRDLIGWYLQDPLNRIPRFKTPPEDDMFSDTDRAKLDTVVNQLTGSYPPKAWDFPGFKVPLYDVPEADQPTFTPMEALAALCVKTLSRLDRDSPSDVKEDLRGDILNIAARVERLEGSFEEMKTEILNALQSE